MIIKFIKKFNKKLIKNKKNILSIFFVCIFFVFFIANPASAADIGDGVAKILGWIASLLTSVIGYFLTFLIKILINVANFSDIIDVPAVQNGWVIIRDLCNMFFVLILLMIAFATILKQENYSAKKLLPKLLIMAVLINFSRTIFGLIIDFSQVIMLTFVNGFGGENAGNFLVNAFQIQEMGGINKTTPIEVSGWDTSVAIILGVIAMLIAFVVVAVMLAVLIMRVMMLWIYTILSPLVFLGFAFPPIQKYTGKIWEDFIKQVVVGPALAFFLWLALTTAGDSSNKLNKFGSASIGEVTGGINALFQEANFQTFIIVIGMLIGGLMVTQQMGGMAGAAAGKGMGWIRGGAAGAAFAPLRGAKKLAKNVGGWGLDKASGVVGIDLNVVEGYKRVQAQMEKNKRDRREKLRGKVLETADEKGGGIRSKLAHLSTGDLAWRNISNWREGGLKSFGKSGKWRTQQFEDIKQEQKKVEGLKEQRSHMLSDEDGMQLVKRKEVKEEELKDVDGEIKYQERIRDDASASFEDRNKAKQEVASLKERESDITKEIGIMAGQEKNINNTEAGRLDEAIKNSNSNIKLKNEQLEEYKIGGMMEARKETAAALTQEQGKPAEYTDNSQELGQMIVDAIKNGQQGLVSVIAKKMARNGDYNETQKALGLGTGREGMLDLAKILQSQGGFSQQGALGLVGEVGNIAKNIKHFGAYGAVTMENGRWRESSDGEYEAAKYAEMSKVQVQAFARDTGRLGLGHYEKMEGDGDDWEHDEKHWVLDKSAIAILKDPSYAQHYDPIKGTANKNAVGHLALDVNVNVLEKNGATAVAANVKGRQDEVKVDPMAAIRNVKK